MINNSFFSTEILRWFRENGRDLPWRETRDPYAIWLSEIILQQTRIAQGWEYWERFMQTYPQVEDLAAASEDDVLKLWQGWAIIPVPAIFMPLPGKSWLWVNSQIRWMALNR